MIDCNERKTRKRPSSYPKRNYRVTNELDEILDPLLELKTDRTLNSDDSVLFVRLSAIGDVVRVLPVYQYLRSNGYEGRIGWAAHPPCDELLRHWPGIEPVHTITRDKWWRHPLRLRNELNHIRTQDYDWSFDFHALMKSTVVTSRLNNGKKVGFSYYNSREFNWFFQDINIGPLPEKLPRILKYLALLRPFTQSFNLRRDDLILNLPDFNVQSVLDGINTHQNPILVHPKTSHDRYGHIKEWGTENFIEFLSKIDPYLPKDQTVLITWGPGEKETAETIVKESGTRVKVAPETPNLRSLFKLIARAKIVISGDTAPCHISDVLGTPLIALFGGSDHLVSGPMFTKYRLLTTRNGDSTKDIPVKNVLKTFREFYEELP